MSHHDKSYEHTYADLPKGRGEENSEKRTQDNKEFDLGEKYGEHSSLRRSADRCNEGHGDQLDRHSVTSMMSKKDKAAVHDVLLGDENKEQMPYIE